MPFGVGGDVGGGGAVVDAGEIEPVRRRDGAAGLAVAGRKGLAHRICRPAPFPHQPQGAHHGTHLIVQEGAGGAFRDHEVPFPADAEGLQRLFRALRLTAGVAEGGEVVVADEDLAGLVHGLHIQRLLHVPGQPLFEGQRRQAVEDAVAVGAADGGKAGVKAFMHLLAGKDSDRVRLAVEVHRPHHGFGRPVLFEIHMRHLTRGMHARIGAPGPANGNLLTAEGLDGTLQHGLHGRAIGLPLPAAEGTAVIFDGQLVAGHRPTRIS